MKCLIIEEEKETRDREMYANIWKSARISAPNKKRLTSGEGKVFQEEIYAPCTQTHALYGIIYTPCLRRDWSRKQQVPKTKEKKKRDRKWKKKKPFKSILFEKTGGRWKTLFGGDTFARSKKSSARWKDWPKLCITPPRTACSINSYRAEKRKSYVAVTVLILGSRALSIAVFWNRIEGAEQKLMEIKWFQNQSGISRVGGRERGKEVPSNRLVGRSVVNLNSSF